MADLRETTNANKRTDKDEKIYFSIKNKTIKESPKCVTYMLLANAINVRIEVTSL